VANDTVVEKFEGRSALMRTSPWLAAENLDGLPDQTCEIEDVLLYKNVSMQDGRKKPQVFALKFKNKDMQLVLNATNRKRLVMLFGTITKEWRGKSVKLYVDDNVKNPSGGAPTKGIRIR
jgi:hypothetical protein